MIDEPRTRTRGEGRPAAPGVRWTRSDVARRAGAGRRGVGRGGAQTPGGASEGVGRCQHLSTLSLAFVLRTPSTLRTGRRDETDFVTGYLQSKLTVDLCVNVRVRPTRISPRQSGAAGPCSTLRGCTARPDRRLRTAVSSADRDREGRVPRFIGGRIVIAAHCASAYLWIAPIVVSGSGCEGPTGCRHQIAALRSIRVV